RRALRTRRRERVAGGHAPRHRAHRRTAAATIESAARAAVPSGGRGGGDRGDDRTRTLADARWLAHVQAAHVLQQCEGRACARLPRPPLRPGVTRRGRLVPRSRLSAMTPLLIALLSCVIWIYLLAARGGFWRALQRDDA